VVTAKDLDKAHFPPLPIQPVSASESPVESGDDNNPFNQDLLQAITQFFSGDVTKAWSLVDRAKESYSTRIKCDDYFLVKSDSHVGQMHVVQRTTANNSEQTLGMWM
jgi:hypothetical protein